MGRRKKPFRNLETEPGKPVNPGDRHGRRPGDREPGGKRIMPINPHGRQNWTPGNIVKIGFLKLKVLAVIPTPGDYKPDQYILESPTGKLYTFTPHHGLKRNE